MKRSTKKVFAALLALAMSLSLAACNNDAAEGSTPAESAGNSAAPSGNGDAHAQGKADQGVTDTTIKIGSTYCTSGTYAYIGVPVIDMMTAVFNRVNAQGGIAGREIEFIQYDDGNDAAVSSAFVEKLVEEDKVFAINMLNGVAVNPCIDYLRDYGIPVVYPSSGLGICYTESDPGNTIFPVQPSSVVAGESLIARVCHESLFGENRDQKLPDDAIIGVTVGTDESSQLFLEGVKKQAEAENRTDYLMIETVTSDTYATAIQKMKDAGVQVLVNAITDTKGLIAAMNDAGWEIPVFNNYNCSNTQSYSPETYSPNRPIYACCWADYTGEDGEAMLADMADALSYSNLDEETIESYKNNNFARAGYFAAMAMVEGLQRIADLGWDFTWDNLIEVYETGGPLNIKALGTVDYSNGQRLGVSVLGLKEYTVVDGEGVMLDSIYFETIETIMSK